MSAVSLSSSSRPVECAVESSGAVRAPGTPGARTRFSWMRTWSMQARRRAGLRSFPWHAAGRHHRPPQRRASGAIARGHQPAAAPGHDRRLGRGRASDPAAESPRLFHAHSMPGLRPGHAVPRLRHRPDASPHRGDRAVPLLRLRGAGPGGLSGLRLRRHPLQRPGHAAAGGGGAGPLPQRPLPADGHRHDAAATAATSGPLPTSAPAR